MRNKPKFDLTFSVNELGLVVGYMTCAGKGYMILTDILTTSDIFSTYFKTDGSLTDEGQLAVDRAKAKRIKDENLVYQDYLYLSRIRKQAGEMAKSLMEKGGAA